MRKNDIVAIIVTYNRKDKLIACIESLLQQKGEKPDILVVDNASTDGTKNKLRDYIANHVISYYNTGENIGGAGGFAYGVNKAYKIGYKYLWLMDDDCIMQENALEKLLCADRKLNGRYGFLSSRVNWGDGSSCKMNIQKKSYSKKITDFDKDLQKLWCATFVSCFIKARTVATVGLPISEFFIWSDDIEYTRRISRIYPCYYVSDSIAIHNTESNNGSDISTDSVDRLDRYSLAYRNEVYIYRREGLKEKLYWLVRLHLHIFRIVKSDKGAKLRRIGALLRGTVDGLMFKPKIKRVRV